MLSQNAKRRIAGHLPLKRDIIDWGPVKLLTFLQFVQFFTVGDKFDLTLPMVEAARRRALEEDFWDEFVVRIDADGNMPAGKFAKRFYTFARVPLAWLKSNPHAVTEEMYKIMAANPRMQWAAMAFKMVETAMGVQIVARDQLDNTDPNQSNPTPTITNVQSPQVLFEQAKLTILTVMRDLTKGLSHDEIKKMSAKDRIASFDKLMNTALKVMGAGRPSVAIFNTIKVESAGRAELEKVALGYAESQQAGEE